MFPNVIIGGPCSFALVAWAGAMKPFLFKPPPSNMFAPALLIMGVVFLVIALTVWLFTPIFRAIRTQTGDIDTQIKLATAALAPILSLLQLLPKPSEVRHE